MALHDTLLRSRPRPQSATESPVAPAHRLAVTRLRIAESRALVARSQERIVRGYRLLAEAEVRLDRYHEPAPAAALVPES